RTVLERIPDFFEARVILAEVLSEQQRNAEAEAEIRKAIALKKDDSYAHYLLGLVLAHQKKSGEAEGAYRESIRLKSDYPEAHCNLGHVLRDQGRFVEALEALRRGHELGSKQKGWPYPSAEWVRQCERFVELDGRFADILKGDSKDLSPADRIDFATLCQRYK